MQGNYNEVIRSSVLHVWLPVYALKGISIKLADEFLSLVPKLQLGNAPAPEAPASFS